MDVKEYRESFLNELRFQAEHEETVPEEIFINKVLTDLEDAGELNDPMPLSVEIRGKRGRLMAFDAYSYDDADSALVLIASDFSNESETVDSLTNTRINDLVTHMENFIDESVNGNMSDYCDDSDIAINIAKEFKRKIGKGMLNSEILRFKFFILSNSLLSKQVKNISRDNFLDRPVELNVWTIERFYQMLASNSSEVVEIETTDFGCEGIPCIKAKLGDKADYDAYLGIVPGKFLADIYLKYGSKLLQGNIRAFLSVRGKVNKGIRNTIINQPENFFTYNNGIAVVARSVRFSDDGQNIVHFKDLQIINGGQTTASLANAIIKKEVTSMDSLFVPMKLTVLNIENEMSEDQIEQYNNITKTISQCANCQNKVTDADFFSNHPFHIMMEKLSAKVMAPPVNGKPYQTTWFYERSRGKWEQEQMKLTPAQRIKYAEMHPKNQVIKKEKLAKCLNSIEMMPNDVCQSSAINFSRFANRIEDIYDKDRDNINDDFFRKSVCSVIIFDSLDSRINKSAWYPKGGDKAQIVPYSISKLMSLIPKGKDINWRAIWQKQAMYSELTEELLKIAYVTQNFFKEKTNGGLVRSYARTLGAWTDFKKYPYELSQRFLDSLVSQDEVKAERNAAKKEHKFNSQIDATVEIFNLGSDYWLKVYSDLSKENVLSYGDLEFIKDIANKFIARGKLISSPQMKRLLKIVSKAEDMGYIMPAS